MRTESPYGMKFAAAYVRGLALQSKLELPLPLCQKRLDALDKEEILKIIAAGKAAGLKLARFEKTQNPLPRVLRVLGFLKSIEMRNLLDVGSGRGAFLWPCLGSFPGVDVLGIDLLLHRVNLMKTVRQGGVTNLDAAAADICDLSLPDKSFDVVTLLEVLEHIENTRAAVESAARIARKYIVVSVPSKPDNNPDHIHLFSKETLRDVFQRAGCAKLHFDGVPGHLIMIAVISK